MARTGPEMGLIERERVNFAISSTIYHLPPLQPDSNHEAEIQGVAVLVAHHRLDEEVARCADACAEAVEVVAILGCAGPAEGYVLVGRGTQADAQIEDVLCVILRHVRVEQAHELTLETDGTFL